MKTCNKCGEVKPISRFPKRSKSIGGYQCQCKDCINARLRERWHTDDEYQRRKKESNARWRKSRPDYPKINYWRNWDYFQKQHKEWQEKNPDYQTIRYRKNPAKILAYTHFRTARMAKLPNSFTSGDWTDVLELFDNKCAYCGDTNNLEQDHFTPLALDGGYEIGNIVPACRSCNASKNKNHPLDWLGMRKYLDVLETVHCMP